MINLPKAVVAAALLVMPVASLRAQHAGDPPATPTPATPVSQPPATASLEERIAAARSVKVMSSILGIELGSELDEAHEKLDKLCAPGTRPKEEGEDNEAREQKEKARQQGDRKENAGGEHERRESKPKLGEEEEEGHKVLWTLAGTDYSAIYVTADDKERIDAITAFLRPEKQMPFDAVGEVSKAPVKDNNSVIWDVLRMGQPLFRVVAKGTDGKANTVQIFIVRRKPGAVVPYAGDGGK